MSYMLEERKCWTWVFIAPKICLTSFYIKGKHLHPGLQESPRQVSELRSNFLPFAHNKSHKNNAQPYRQPSRGALRVVTVVFLFLSCETLSPVMASNIPVASKSKSTVISQYFITSCRKVATRLCLSPFTGRKTNVCLCFRMVKQF